MTTWLTRLRPEPGDLIDPATAASTDDDGLVTRFFGPVEDALGQVPPLAWVIAILVLGMAMVVTLPLARRRARAAGAKAAGHTPPEPGDRALFAAAMAPAALFLAAVLAGSFRGLAAFGRDTLHWTGGWEYLVPGTLDGVALSFGFLAFRAVRKGHSPDRANRLVWAAALASALINFAHEASLPTGSWLGGAYLALMSVFGMLIFHEFLAQFEEGAQVIHRKVPKYGLRWITWPTNTGCAWVAWHNHPVPDGTPATVAASVAHLEQVRAQKRARLASTDQPAWWMRLAPWLRIRQLEALRDGDRKAAGDQLASVRAEWERARVALVDEVKELRSEVRDAQTRAAEHAERAVALSAELKAERASATTSAARTEQTVERLRRAMAEQAERLSAEHAEQLARLRSAMAEDLDRRLAAARAEHTHELSALRAAHAAELAALAAGGDGRATRGSRSKVTPLRRSNNGGRPAVSFATDAEALAAMFAEHPERDYVWGTTEVNRITGAGYSSRAPRLVTLAVTHQQQCPGERHSGCFVERQDADDPKEDSRVRELVNAAG